MATVAEAILRLISQADTSGIRETKEGLQDLDATTAEAGASIGSSLAGVGSILVAIGTAIAGALGVGVLTAANFEQAMANVKAVLQPTGEEFENLRQLALRLGRDTLISSTEAAAAIEELAKAGVPIENILAGAADA